jgi:hypothetical protein
MTDATKYDGDKPPMDLLPHSVLLEVARVLGFGAAKYSKHNWRQGFDWSRLHAAALRHIGAWGEGENLDKESSINHIAHAICCLMFLLEHQIKGYGVDDRFINVKPTQDEKRKCTPAGGLPNDWERFRPGESILYPTPPKEFINSEIRYKHPLLGMEFQSDEVSSEPKK